MTSFIREETRENTQIIVISLKEQFFSKSDALLGVYSDVTKFLNMLQVGEELLISICHDSAVTVVFSSSQFAECMFSRMLTLDLRPYPLVEEDSEKEPDSERTGPV